MSAHLTGKRNAFHVAMTRHVVRQRYRPIGLQLKFYEADDDDDNDTEIKSQYYRHNFKYDEIL